MVLWPLVVFFIATLLVPAGMIILSSALGQQHNEHATGSPYEAGIVSEGTAEARFSIKFYLIAMFFVVFDLEAVFIFSWAIATREVGWAGYLEILFFTVILVATLVYLWRLGALDWGPKTKRKTR
ncbi:MAG TPA: NADH-quinone oxidoreductase subunit A [Terriglobia bacterium]|nr:NADH-quinone oxidoreductase subunit A [Terriglobia bacterium]